MAGGASVEGGFQRDGVGFEVNNGGRCGLGANICGYVVLVWAGVLGAPRQVWALGLREGVYVHIVLAISLGGASGRVCTGS